MGEGRQRRGFSLMELLVAMGVIAALAALALPLFIDQLNHWRRETDIQTARDGYAAAQSEWLMGDHTYEDIFYYDSGSGKVLVNTEPSSRYGEWNGEADYSIADVAVSGNAAQEGYISFSFNSDGTLSDASWGVAGMGLWRSIAGTAISDTNWWDSFDNAVHVVRSASFERLQAIDNATRKAADIRILRALARYFEGLSVEEMAKILGDKRFPVSARVSGRHISTMIFQYTQDAGGSIRIANIDTEYVPYFAGIGYDALIYKTQGNRSTWDLTDHYVTGGYNYVNKYLFVSDAMLGTSYKDHVEHNINIEFDVVGDHVANVVISVNDGLAAQGYTSKR